jgi:hypothetical protein
MNSEYMGSTVIQIIFGPKTDAVTMESRKLHNEELNDPYCSPNIVRLIKSRRMRWKGTCSTYGGKERCIHSFWWGNVEERVYWQDPGLDGRIILR